MCFFVIIPLSHGRDDSADQSTDGVCSWNLPGPFQALSTPTEECCETSTAEYGTVRVTPTFVRTLRGNAPYRTVKKKNPKCPKQLFLAVTRRFVRASNPVSSAALWRPYVACSWHCDHQSLWPTRCCGAAACSLQLWRKTSFGLLLMESWDYVSCLRYRETPLCGRNPSAVPTSMEMKTTLTLECVCVCVCVWTLIATSSLLK